MCGIAGFVDYKNNIKEKRNIIENMTDTLVHRGPDSRGIYVDTNVLLGHRRLAVIDPQKGLQPMKKNINGREYVIIYNGELYNTEELRNDLIKKGYSFDTDCDTEVLLMTYIYYGIDGIVKLNGIYAFAIYDSYENRVLLARDRLGVKPLFYSLINDTLIFASEIKALLKHPYIEPILDKDGICELFGLGPARSIGSGIFRDIKEIPPACYAIYNENKFDLKSYWKLQARPHEEDLKTTIEHTRDLVTDAIRRQLVSDVPICTFLSGGLDSSIISSVASEYFRDNNKGILDTFSVDYVDNDKYFKASIYQPNSDDYFINIMNEYTGSNHHYISINNNKLYYSLRDAVLANDLPGMADVDSSLLLFCKEVRKHATVSLSGECADEIFGGYPWFVRDELIYANTFPWSRAIDERVSILNSDYSNLPLREYVDSKYKEAINEVPRLDSDRDLDSKMREITYLNLKYFMITLLNRKDRMSMANSLEVRVPFADHRIVEYIYNVPWSIKNLNNREKGLLREAMKGILPKEIVERKKSPYPKTHNPLYKKEVVSYMKNLLNNNNAPILSIIDKKVVSDIVESEGNSFKTPWFGQLMTGPQLIAYLIQINTWLREYNVVIK